MSKLGPIVVNTCVLLLLAEGGARVAEWANPAQDAVSFGYAPYRMLRMTEAPWPLNEQGFRAGPLESYRGSFLIEFLGGSVCLGVGEDTGPSLPERLEAALHAAGMKRAKVLNLCQGGAPSAQELAVFLEYGLPLGPEVVLSFNGANDLMHPRPLGEDDRANLPYRDREMRALIEGAHSVAAHLALARVAARVARRLPRAAAPVEGGVPAATILNSYLYTTEVVRTLTVSQGGLHAVLLQPTLHYRKPWSQAERSMWAERRPGDTGEFSRYAGDLFTQAARALTAWSAETGAPFYDLTGVFAGREETIYSDSVHFTGSEGYAALETALTRDGLIARIGERYATWESHAPEFQTGETHTWLH